MTKTDSSMKTWFSLSNTTCVIAGANGLLGSACAKAVSDCGATAVSVDTDFSRTPPGQQLRVDLTDEAAVDSLFAELEKPANDGRAWAFINASYPRTQNWGTLGFENVSLKDWNENVSLHLGSTFLFARKAVAFLRTRGGGAIINFGSVYGMCGPDLRIYDGTPMQNPVPYASIKAGIAGLSRYIATAYGKNNIRANVVSPGGIENGQPESFVRAYNARTPLARMGTVDDIAGVVAFLAGPSARYVTGQEIAVDGGWTAW